MVYPSCVSSQENKQTLPFFPYTKGNILHAIFALNNVSYTALFYQSTEIFLIFYPCIFTN